MLARRPLLWLSALLALAPGARADEVTLRGGTRLEGVVLEQGDAGVRLLLPEGVELALAADDVASVARDPKAPAGDRFVRYVEERGAGRLQTAVVHLLGPDGRRVDLIGALHIADRSFFRAVQALLERADVVLYEIVKPKDVSVEELAATTNPIREFQQKLAVALDLVFQMDEIDYDRPHFVHADLTPEEMGVAPSADGAPAKGEAALPPQVREALPQLQLLGAFLDTLSRTPEQKAELKRTMARMVGSFGPQASKILGPEVSEALIGRRNAVVVERLAAVPPEARTVAVFYGGGHLPDLEKRLVEMGYRRAGARWLDGWTIAAAAKRADEK